MSAAPAPQLSVEFLCSLLSAMPVFVVRGDADLRLRYANHVRSALTPREVFGADLLDYVSPEDRAMVRGVLERVIETNEPGRYETMGPGDDGSQARYECTVTPVADPDGRRGVCIIAMDVTERHRRQIELQQSEQKLRLALETTGIGLWSWDLRTGEMWWDERMKQICGRDEACDPPTYIDSIVHPDDRQQLQQAGDRILETREYVGHPHRIVRRDGEVRWIVPTGTVFTDPSGAPMRIVGGCMDMTRERARDEEARRGRRMEAIGRLSAGIAHNINNMLMVVLPTLAELRERVSPEDAAALQDAEHAARSSAEMVRQLMRFSGQASSAQPVAQPIVPIVERALRLCRRTVDARGTVNVDLAADLPCVACIGGDIEQVLVNVLLNAADAFEEKLATPTIEIRVAPVSVSELRPHPNPNPNPDWGEAHEDSPPGAVRITIADNGRGLDPAELERVFEPFFTTKSSNGGTGLGLFMAYAIAQRHGGSLRIESTKGVGTIVSLVLPAGTPDRQERPPLPDLQPQVSPSYRVLLVEDEQAVRRVLERNLSRDGFRVSACGGVTAATQLLEEGLEVDLVLLDRSMPDGPGDRLVPVVRRLVPTARILFLTGREVEPEAARRVDGVITKPVTNHELRAAILGVMAQVGSAVAGER